MTLYSKNSSSVFHSNAREVYDVTGAGDTVIATLVWALISERAATLPEACSIANEAAGIVVGKLGSAVVTQDELTLPRTDFEKIELSKRQGKRIVFTNGCFDILHEGHLHLLREAKKMGDILVVGVDADELVHQAKGVNRPINSLEKRMALLRGLAVVDFVFPFSDLLSLIQKITPDVLVKGDDYQINNIVGADCVISSGGQVKTVPKIGGASTTSIVSKILNTQNYE